MEESKKQTVQLPLGEFMNNTMLDELKSPSGQAMIKRLTEILTFQILQSVELKLRAMAKHNGGLVDVEQFLTRLKLPMQ